MNNTPKPAAFLDRDGVICEYVDSLHKKEDLILRPKVAEAILSLNQKGYWVFVVTNQPMIAKGLLTIEELEGIHQKMRGELEKTGAKIDGIQYCPHLKSGSVAPWNVDCLCRKPQAGMVHQLLQHFEVDLKHSFFAGDTWRDIECAKKVGIKSYGIHGGAGFPYPPESEFFSNQPFCFASSLFEAVQTELKSAPYSP